MTRLPSTAAALLLALGALRLAAPSGTADAAALPALRSVSGPELRSEIAASHAEVVVVNVWATWCIPCREEFPALLRLRDDYRKRRVALLLVSGDFPSERDAAREFLAAAGVDFPTYLKTGKDMEFIDALHSDWSGALPATFVYDGTGKLLEWWEGAAIYDRFAAAVERALAGTGKEKP